jgi:hypothetical protein
MEERTVAEALGAVLLAASRMEELAAQVIELQAAPAAVGLPVGVIVTEWSPERGELIAALAKAQGVFTTVKPDREQQITSTVKRKYATLDAYWTAARKGLSDNGLAVVQSVEELASDRHELVIRSDLLHPSGQYCTSRLRMPVMKQDPQGLGSTITYGKRYLFGAQLGLTMAEEDDDGDARLAGASAGGRGDEDDTVPHPTLAAAKTVPDLVHAMNELSQRQKAANRVHFNEFKKSLEAAKAVPQKKGGGNAAAES